MQYRIYYTLALLSSVTQMQSQMNSQVLSSSNSYLIRTHRREIIFGGENSEQRVLK